MTNDSILSLFVMAVDVEMAQPDVTGCRLVSIPYPYDAGVEKPLTPEKDTVTLDGRRAIVRDGKKDTMV